MAVYICLPRGRERWGQRGFGKRGWGRGRMGQGEDGAGLVIQTCCIEYKIVSKIGTMFGGSGATDRSTMLTSFSSASSTQARPYDAFTDL